VEERGKVAKRCSLMQEKKTTDQLSGMIKIISRYQRDGILHGLTRLWRKGKGEGEKGKSQGATDMGF